MGSLIPGDEKVKDFLGSLPNELLGEIAELLLPNPTALPNPEAHHSSAAGVEERQGREALRNLCLVSHQFDGNFRPFLFKAPVVSDSGVLLRLYRTLVEKPALGQYVKRLVYEVAIDSEDPRHVKLNHNILSATQFFNAMQAWHSSNHTSMEYLEHELTCSLYFAILETTTNLEWLSLNIQSRRIKSKSQSHLELYSNSFYPLARQVSAASNCSTDGRPFLPKLKSLSLLGNNSRPSLAAFPAGILDHFLQLSSLEELICFRDNGRWHDLLLRNGGGYIRGVRQVSTSITSLRLENSSCHPPDIYHVCNTFPSLKSFSIITNSMDGSRHIADNRAGILEGAGLLSDALAMLKDLQSLTLDIYLTSYDFYKLGPLTVLDLRPLSNLRYLRVPLKFFLIPYTMRKASAGLLTHPFCSPVSVLPPSLVSLTIWIDVSWDPVLYERNHISGVSLRHDVPDFLNFLAYHSGPDGRFTELQEVAYRYRIGDYTNDAKHGDYVAALEEAFGNKGVMFSALEEEMQEEDL
ncbi:hypothetical protein VM1G_04665 [Cytospora mali]|uniref:F-box domain-containing protein n=1 Tax=Cytospora mali TaxID=578113 RepID=A0A194VWV8_CYTMA|nr:hypothetical protein VM1G_04665 [Valsa mali]